ncbi:hypothetical protein QQZ08_004222 [Neonectria magnoliae]|uniref:Uncharacterized protein n=1 Tax=Neonectria magnoliae TaxID=2732573 RepID=A0ABR1I8S8_9HYPO
MASEATTGEDEKPKRPTRTVRGRAVRELSTGTAYQRRTTHPRNSARGECANAQTAVRDHAHAHADAPWRNPWSALAWPSTSRLLYDWLRLRSWAYTHERERIQGRLFDAEREGRF